MPDIQATDLRATFTIDKLVKDESINFAISQARLFALKTLTDADGLTTIYDDVISDTPVDATRSEIVRNGMLKLAFAHLIEQNAFRLTSTGILHRELDASSSPVGNNVTHEYQRIEDVKNFAESLAAEARVAIRSYQPDETANRTQFRRLVRA